MEGFALPPRPFPEEAASVDAMLLNYRRACACLQGVKEFRAQWKKRGKQSRLSEADRQAIAYDERHAKDVAREWGISWQSVYRFRALYN